MGSVSSFSSVGTAVTGVTGSPVSGSTFESVFFRYRSDGLLGLSFSYQVVQVGGHRSDRFLGLGFSFQVRVPFVLKLTRNQF